MNFESFEMRSQELLYVILPVYNEEENIDGVFDEWLPTLEKVHPHFKIIAINDGSKDSTLAHLIHWAKFNEKIKVIDKPNTGHGQTCFLGYRAALEAKADWIFQIDSDGQCDPSYFPLFWENRNKTPVTMGYRYRRDDGYFRVFASQVVKVVVFWATKIWVRDPNVPYRLIRAKELGLALAKPAPTFHLANILLSVRLKQKFSIKWISIHFRDRFAGSSSTRFISFYRTGLQLFQQLKDECKKN